VGCDVAYGASGWKHAVIIGSEAGANATVSNPSLGMDMAAVFVGHRAGYNCNNLENVIGIGTNAANNADGASDSVFIGSNAGLDGSYANSIGIGEHALRGTLAGGEGGTGNLEIVCAIDDNNRLMYSGGALSNRVNIMNTIAGRTDIPNISVGMPRLSPEAPLEVRRHSSVHGSNPNDFVQSWFCDDVLVASMDCDGNLYAGSGNIANVIEGLMDTAITGGTLAVPASGRMSIYEDGTDTGQNIYVTNRDSSMTGVPIGTFVVATRLKTEYRPTWVGCP